MKKYIFIALILLSAVCRAQKIDSIFVNLYTDSLKKGTYNYINIDGLLSNGEYMPLDSTLIIFSASAGRFFGNSLWIEPDFAQEKVTIKVKLRSNPALNKVFEMHIKKKPDDEKLKTTEELLKEMRKKGKG